LKKLVYFDTSALVKEFAPSELGYELIDKITTSARQDSSKLQIISSVWAINEAVAVLDRKFRKGEITEVEMQTVMATLFQRIKDSSENTSFRFAPIDHSMIANSRSLIAAYHISADDALHIYTGWIYDCDYLLFHDSKIMRIKPLISTASGGNVNLTDLGDAADRKRLEAQLSL
jgi:predicted nucleic acid-binding protein